MLTCPTCGRESPDDFAFCPACGASLTPAPPSRDTRKTVTVLFCDVTGSTALGERLDPESLRDMQSRYFDVMRKAIERHGGMVEKYIGDAVMAVFGIPQLHEDDALRAVRAAIDMREAVEILNSELERDWGVTIATRTGVNTGEVVAGDHSTGQVMVTGDAVNVAARLEEAAKPGDILIGEVTQHLARDAIASESLGSLLIRGRKRTFGAHRLLEVLPTASGHRRRFDLPMVGRVDELAQMRQEFDRVVSSNACRLLTVVGSAGIGKSRIVREFSGHVRTTATVLRGRCPAYGMGVMYWPIKEAMDEIVGPPSERWMGEITESAGAEEAKRIIEQVSAAFGPGQGTGSHDEIRWALRRVLEIRAQQQPVVLVFEDFQWAEPTFVDLIHHITDESTGSPLLLICIGRTELVDVHSQWSAARDNASVLSVEPLTDADCELMLSNLLEGRDIDGGIRDQITEAAAGNPLFAEETLSLLIEQGRLVEEEGRWVAHGGLRRISAPPTIAALISTRLDGLPEPERTVLEGASVVGLTFDTGAVEVVCELTVPIASTLASLVAREFIEVSEPDQYRDSFVFRHALIRDAAYAGMGKDRRARMHVRLADWLTGREQLAGESAELIGYHLEQAFAYRAELGSLGDEGTWLGTRAAAQLWAAGRTALNGRGDLLAATALFDRATPMISEEDTMSIEMRLDQAQALAGLGRLEPAVSMISHTLDRAKRLKERRLLARAEVRRMLIQNLITTPGWTSEASAVAQRGIRVLERFKDDIGLAEALVLLASVRWSECRASLTEGALQRAAALYRRAGDRAAELEQIVWIGATALLGPTPTDQGIERIKGALDEVAGFPRAEASLMSQLAHLLAMRGNFEEARTLSSDAVKILDDLGDRARGASLVQTSIWVDLMTGDAATAEGKARAAYELLNDLGARSAQGVVGALLARALLELARFEEAESLAASIEEVRPDDIRTRLTCGTVRARALASLGKVGVGESEARAVVQLAKKTDFINEEGDARLDLGEILEIAGQPAFAAKAIQSSLVCYARKGNVVSAGRAQQVSSRLSNI
jgi:class 3 adenylate cyclase/tetratricopeptide (TPR) repeat protein